MESFVGTNEGKTIILKSINERDVSVLKKIKINRFDYDLWYDEGKGNLYDNLLDELNIIQYILSLSLSVLIINYKVNENLINTYLIGN